MIRATAVLSAGGCLRLFKAAGHAAAGDRGYDTVCAAFSVLARTAYRALEALPGAELRGFAPEPGNLSFELSKPATNIERAAGIADFLIVGMGDLARDYPDAVEFVLERDWRE
jgi:uncharacterized protein YsxB (DUF464 family)